jgi:hypothetical protein
LSWFNIFKNRTGTAQVSYLEHKQLSPWHALIAFLISRNELPLTLRRVEAEAKQGEL